MDPAVRPARCSQRGVEEAWWSLMFTNAPVRAAHGARGILVQGLTEHPYGLQIGPTRQDPTKGLPGAGEGQEHDHARHSGLRARRCTRLPLPSREVDAAQGRLTVKNARAYPSPTWTRWSSARAYASAVGSNAGSSGLMNVTPSSTEPGLKSSLNTISTCPNRAAAQIWAS